jgi:hypothetical protein
MSKAVERERRTEPAGPPLNTVEFSDKLDGTAADPASRLINNPACEHNQRGNRHSNFTLNARSFQAKLR